MFFVSIMRDSCTTRFAYEYPPLHAGLMCALLCLTSGACSQVIGLDDWQIVAADAGSASQCRYANECPQSAGNPMMCRQPDGSCIALRSSDCQTITGPQTDLDRAVVIGSLFSLAGTDGASNSARQQSAELAVEEVNAVGGIPTQSTADAARPLIMVSCDASADLLRAARHLVEDLGVPAIVGPNSSQDTLDLSQQLTIRAGTAVISPTAFTGSIADLADDDLTWQMVASDLQRAPITLYELNSIETDLKQQRALGTVKLGVVFQDNALGTGTVASLSELVINERPLSDVVNLGHNVRIDPFNAGATTAGALVAAYAQFAPDIVLLAGAPDMVTELIIPLENAWHADRPRPYYVLIDSLKAPALMDAVAGHDELRQRIRGTGVTPGPGSQPVYDAFRVSYEIRHPGSESGIAGMGPSYDATYAIALALAGTTATTVTGHTLVDGLLQLSGGTTDLSLKQANLLDAFGLLAKRQRINAIGTFGPLAWDTKGAVAGGTLEMWCISSRAGTLAFDSSGLTLDLASRTLHGTYAQCP